MTGSNAVSIPGALTTATSKVYGTAIAAAPGSLPSGGNPTYVGAPLSPPAGTVITATVTGWAGTTSAGYEWFRCDLANTSCVRIVGATNPYTLTDADVLHTVRARYYGINGAGTAFSDLGQSTGEILPGASVNTKAPQVVGLPWTGQPLVGNVGGWNAPANFVRFWQVCDQPATGCQTKGSFSTDTKTYTPTPDDVGKYVRFGVDADPNGPNQLPNPTEVYAAAVGPVVVAPERVANTETPSIDGFAVVTQALALQQGTWVGGPTLTNQWFRCDGAGGSCAAIPSATGPTLPLTGAEVGHRFHVVVTGTNAWPGKVIATTPDTAPVAASLKPIYAGGAQVTGSKKVGKRLVVVVGSWTAIPAATFTYTWLRNGKPIKGATKANHRVQTGDRHRRISCRIKARNSGGTTILITAAVRIR